MKVFISWSGTKSRETANILSSWIRQVIQAAETWISLDIDKGTRWNEKINKELEETKVGIICLNKENLTSEWILFEAGALSKTNDVHVCTFLLDVKPADIKPPLGQFQHTSFTKDDVRKLIHTINSKIITNGEKSIPEKDLEEVFETFWPKLEERLSVIRDSNNQSNLSLRTEREILEEILQTVRALDSKTELQNRWDSESSMAQLKRQQEEKLNSLDKADINKVLYKNILKRLEALRDENSNQELDHES